MLGWTIGGLARQGGVGVETIRYYQRRGLLGTPERPPAGLGGGVRRYSDEDVRRLKFIRSAQYAGFTLNQIGELLTLDASHDRPRARMLARGRIGQLDEEIAKLRKARAALVSLEKACAGGAHGPCPIIAAFEPLANALLNERTAPPRRDSCG